MIGFTYNENNRLVADRDMTVIAWAMGHGTIGADGTQVGIGFEVNGSGQGDPFNPEAFSLETGDPEGEVDLEVTTTITLSAGDVLGFRIYSDDPSNVFTASSIVIAEMQTDLNNETQWAEADSYALQAKYYLNPASRPIIVPSTPGAALGSVLKSRSGFAFDGANNAGRKASFPFWDLPNHALYGPLSFGPADVGAIGLNDGQNIFGMGPGQILNRVLVFVTEAWDGTTPQLNLYTDDNNLVLLNAYDLTFASEGAVDSSHYQALEMAAVGPLLFTISSASVKLKIDDGAGNDPGSTVGSISLYIEIIVPIPPD